MSLYFPLKYSCTGSNFIYLRRLFEGYRDQPRWISSSVFLFPGQGAQYVGMCKRLLTDPQAVKLFEDAQKILGYDLLSLCLNGPVEELKKTEKCQPAVVVSSLAALYYHSKKAAIEPLQEWPVGHHTSVKTAGLSVGELSALMFAQALSLEDGLRVVKVRAQAMQQACQQHPSGMVSIVGPAAVDLQALFDAAKHWSLTKGTKEPVACLANYLFPGGWVLGGDRSSIDYILKYGKVKHGIRRIQPLTSSGAFHTELMKSAQEPLQQILDSIDVQMPKVTVYSGTSCHPFTSPGEIKRLLVQQLVEPVYWLDTIKNMFRDMIGIESHVYEAGPGQQLRAMLYRIDRTLLSNYTHLET